MSDTDGMTCIEVVADVDPEPYEYWVMDVHKARLDAGETVSIPALSVLTWTAVGLHECRKEGQGYQCIGETVVATPHVMFKILVNQSRAGGARRDARAAGGGSRGQPGAVR